MHYKKMNRKVNVNGEIKHKHNTRRHKRNITRESNRHTTRETIREIWQREAINIKREIKDKCKTRNKRGI